MGTKIRVIKFGSKNPGHKIWVNQVVLRLFFIVKNLGLATPPSRPQAHQPIAPLLCGTCSSCKDVLEVLTWLIVLCVCFREAILWVV